jgi:GABA permease
MSRYLVVAHQTAANPRLIQRVVQVSHENPASEFVLLVPATEVKHLPLPRRDDAGGRLAERRAAEARTAFAAAGVELADARVGAPSPLQAVADEMARGAAYDGVIISTLPAEQSRWLRADLPAQVGAQHGVPVIHVQATLADIEALQQMP